MPAVLITGASRGIGLATARRFAAEGWTVFAGHRDLAHARGLTELADENPRVRPVRMDVGEPDQIEAAFHVADDHGVLDAVVNNAAVIPVGPLIDQSVDTIENTLATNLTGPVLVARAAATRMMQQGHGTILQVSSLAGRNASGPPLTAVYNTTKAALVAFSYHLAKELVPFGIRVRVAELGAWRTDGVDGIVTDLAACDDTGPFGALVRRVRATAGAAIVRAAGDPADAGEALYQLIKDHEPFVRRVVPRKAQQLADGAERITDDELLRLWAVDDIEAWMTTYHRLVTQAQANSTNG